MKTVIVTGCAGQDGSLLSEFLLEKDYKVYGLARRSSDNSFPRLSYALKNSNFELITCDITDASGIFRIVKQIQPDELYNLAATSHVGQSFNDPITTMNVVTNGCLNLLEAIRVNSPVTKFYQASSSEMFGTQVSVYGGNSYQDENTKFEPQSPYAIAKVAAHHLTVLYRKSYRLFTSCGILFNHESERRGSDFVTKKITNFVRKLQQSTDIPKLRLGNVNASRDWGYAKDYVRAMWLMLQQNTPEDYVVCTGETHTVKEFLDEAFRQIGIENWRAYVEINCPEYVRPSEVPYLKGSAFKALVKLGWKPNVTFKELVRLMVAND